MVHVIDVCVPLRVLINSIWQKKSRITGIKKLPGSSALRFLDANNKILAERESAEHSNGRIVL